MASLEEGDMAPAFELPGSDGEPVRLSDFEGQPVVLYFYPSDFTLFCTREACSFRDRIEDFQDEDAAVVGISSDPPESHARFRDEHDLPYTLLSDVEGTVAEAYGADGWFRTKRITFVLGPDHVVRARIRSPFPGPHIRKALEQLRDDPSA